jgi:hypothetical protein
VSVLMFFSSFSTPLHSILMFSILLYFKSPMLGSGSDVSSLVKTDLNWSFSKFALVLLSWCKMPFFFIPDTPTLSVRFDFTYFQKVLLFLFSKAVSRMSFTYFQCDCLTAFCVTLLCFLYFASLLLC